MTDRNTSVIEAETLHDSMGSDEEESKEEAKSGKAFVMKVRNELEPFKYELYTPTPAKRTTKPN